MRHFGLISVLAAVAGLFAGYGVLELVADPASMTREIAGVQVEIEPEGRLYRMADVVVVLAAGAMVAAFTAYALARAIPVTPRRRR